MEEQPKTYEPTGHVLKDGDEEMIIDQTVLNNPDWIMVSDCEAPMKVGDRQVRNTGKKLNWERRYAYVKGKPILHYRRNTVIEYVKQKYPNDFTPMAPKQQSSNQPEIFQSVTEHLGKIANTHEIILAENSELHKKVNAIENETTFWKTSVYWLAAMAVIVVGGVSISWVFSNKAKNTVINSLSSQIQEQQNELTDTKANLIKSQTEFKTWQSMYKINQTTNSTGVGNVQN